MTENNNDTIKTIARLVSNYFRGGWNSEDAMDAIGRVLKENSAAFPASNGRELKKDHGGYVVTDRSGLPTSYPTATNFEVTDDGRLMIRDSGVVVIAVYNKLMWASVEKIAA